MSEYRSRSNRFWIIAALVAVVTLVIVTVLTLNFIGFPRNLAQRIADAQAGKSEPAVVATETAQMTADEWRALMGADTKTGTSNTAGFEDVVYGSYNAPAVVDKVDEAELREYVESLVANFMAADAQPASAAELVAAPVQTTNNVQVSQTAEGYPTEFYIHGVPEVATNYETSEYRRSTAEYVEGGPFVSSLPYGMRLLMGFPGVALNSDITEAQLQDAEGAIQRFNSLNQRPLDDDEFNIGCGERTFLHIVAGHMFVTFENGIELSLPQRDGNNYWVLVRCPYTNDAQNGDNGMDVTISGYRDSYGEVMILPPGGFIAQDDTLLAVQHSHNGITSGSEGASDLTFVILDTNTRGYAVYVETETAADMVDRSITFDPVLISTNLSIPTNDPFVPFELPMDELTTRTNARQ